MASNTAHLQPAPGHILLETIEETESNFESTPNPDETTARKGKVLAIGPAGVNQFGVTEASTCFVGQYILYRHLYNQDEFRFEFKKYPVITFDQVLGVFED